MFRRLCGLSVVLSALMSCCEWSRGAEPPLAAEKLVVDVVTLKSGTQYRGVVLGRTEDGTVSMAVQREWLKRTQPKEFETLAASESQQTQLAAQQLLARLNAWLQKPLEPATLHAFVDLERERIETLLNAVKDRDRLPEPPQFMWISFLESRVRTSFTQPTASRKWMALAWQARLADVERRSADDIRKELTAKGVTLDTPVNLAERLPMQTQTDDEWAARRALVEARFGKRVEFQGLGETWVRTDGDVPKADLQQLLPSILQSQLQSQLGDLLGETGNKPKATSSLNKAIEQADAANVSGFRVTELKLDLARSKVAVTTKFVARLAPQRWDVIWQQTLEEDAAKARPEAERRIGDDPQLKDTLGLLRGLDVAGGDVVTKAVRTGAAVMSAQQTIDTEYHNFVSQHTRRLDGPPLRK